MLCFVGNGDQKKFTKNPRHFSCKIPRQIRKIIHKMFLERGPQKISSFKEKNFKFPRNYHCEKHLPECTQQHLIACVSLRPHTRLVCPIALDPTSPNLTVVSKLITDRDFFLGGINFRLQIQKRAARRISFHYRDRSLGISAENLSLQIQILSGIPINSITDADFGLETI